MDAIGSQIDTFFDRLLPALILLAVFLVATALIAGPIRFRSLSGAYTTALERLDTFAKRDFVKESGVLKVLPIAVLVLFVGLALSLQRLATWSGQKVAPDAISSEPNLTLLNSSPKDLAIATAAYPGVANGYELLLILEMRHDKLVSDPNARSPKEAYWSEENNYGISVVWYASFMAAYALLLFVTVAIRRRFRGLGRLCFRVVLTLVATGTFIAYGLWRQFDSKRWIAQYAVERIATEILVSDKAPDPKAIDAAMPRVKEWIAEAERSPDADMRVGFGI